MNRQTKKLAYLAGVAVLVGLGVLWLYPRAPAEGKYDSLAQCLRDRGAIMYGAEWCPHCQDQKRDFGSAFRHIEYVECPDNPKLCAEKGVKGFPTWIFPDGEKLEGRQKLERLATKTQCALPPAEGR